MTAEEAFKYIVSGGFATPGVIAHAVASGTEV